MRLNPALLPVKTITSKQARSLFPPDLIEKAARAILEAEGMINPIVVRELRFQEFEVIDGHLEYHAAVRARELDLIKGEMIDAIVVEPENEAAILEQIRLLRAGKTIEQSPITADYAEIELRLNNLEKQIENQLNELNRRLVELNSQGSNQQMAELIQKTVSTVMQAQLPTIVDHIVQQGGTNRRKANRFEE